MKTIKIKSLLTLLVCLIYGTIIISSCSNTEQKQAEHSHEEGDHHEHSHAAGDEHEHIYTCPMKCPGSQSNEPGKCPVCGMDLEHSDEALSNKNYQMSFHSDPDKLEAGKSAKFYFKPIDKDDEGALVPIDVVHEKKIHMMVFSSDLAYFEHIHPEYTASGDYIIEIIAENDNYAKGRGLKETKFIEGGEYIMYMDYTPTGASNQVEKIPITVSGNERTHVPLGEQRLVWEDNGYIVTLGADKEFTINTSIQLHVNITKDGKPVANLDNYLGALAHMAVLSEDMEEYLHVHPMDSKTTGPDIYLHTNFPKESKYKVFMQFNHEEIIHTTNFVLDVGHDHNEHAHDHTH
ncbi:MAG: hypothetical protein COC01_03700 [Bacteroidetes bacterium]|nr:MAG: hypothetical protein COC01_03700 [Bacteroidota bacterium]